MVPLRALLPRRAPRDPRQVPLRRQRFGLRRLASAGMAAAALGFALQVLAPDPPPGATAVVAAQDLAAGTPLRDGDLRVTHVPAATLPHGAVELRAARGRMLASAARAGEVLTDARLVGPGLLLGQPPGQVAAPVRVADPGAAALVTPGDRVDVLLAGQGHTDAQVVVRAATVLARPARAASDTLLGGGDPDSGSGGLLVLAVPSAEAAALAGAAARGPLSITLLSTPLR